MAGISRTLNPGGGWTERPESGLSEDFLEDEPAETDEPRVGKLEGVVIRGWEVGGGA